MLRRAAVRGLRSYATDAQQVKPAAGAKSAAAAAKPAGAAASTTPQKPQPTASATTTTTTTSAPIPPKAPEPAPTPTPKAAEPKKEAPKTDATPAPSTTGNTEEYDAMLARQQATLQRMLEEIQVARGERSQQLAVTGDTHLRDVPKMMSCQAKKKAAELTARAKVSGKSLQGLMAQKSTLAIEAAALKRKEIGELSRENQLPWQKDRPAVLYTQAGKWFLQQQQGIAAPVWMTAIEFGVVILVLLFWFYQSRKAKAKKHLVNTLVEGAEHEGQGAQDALAAAKKMWATTVLDKNEEIRDAQQLISEQSVTIDSLARCMNEPAGQK